MINKKAVAVMVLLLIVIIGIVTFTQCSKPKTITIGAILPVSGANTDVGTSSRDALMLAVEQYNSKGGVLGSKINLQIKDDRSNLKEATNSANILIKNPEVRAIIGENFSSETMALAAPVVASGIPLISPSASNPQVTELGSNIFKAIATDDFQVGILAKFAKNDLNSQGIAILYNQNDWYSSSMAKGFEQIYKSYGRGIAYVGYYSMGDTDFEAQINQIKAAGADTIFLAESKTEILNNIMKQFHDKQMNIKYLCTDGFSQLYQKVPGNQYATVYHTLAFSAENQDPKVQEFVKAYKQKYSRTPDLYAALSYDSICMALEAMQKAGTTDKGVLTRTISEIGFDGVTGRIKFGQDRNPIKPMSIMKVVDGKAEFVKIIEP